MADGYAATRKRKYPVKRTIGLIVQPDCCDTNTIAALYKFDIDISSSGHDDDVIVQSEDADTFLDPIFKHEFDRQIGYVGCGIIGSKLFLFPNEIPQHQLAFCYPTTTTDTSSLTRIQPLQFDFKNNQTDPLTKCPGTLKVRPFVIPIHDKIFLLSVANSFVEILEPAFEVYDPTTGSFEPLPRPPFYDKLIPCCEPLGYAILTTSYKHEDFIIVMGLFCEGGDASTASVGFFSCNLQTFAWKRVSVAKGAKYSYWLGETVVVEGYAYFHSMYNNTLQSCSIHYHEETDGFSLGKPSEVEGLRMRTVPLQYAGDMETRGIAKIGDRMLCVVRTSFPEWFTWQYVLVSIIQIREGDPSSCETLSSLIFGLPNLIKAHRRNALMLTSCFALSPDVTSSLDQIEGGRDRKKQLLQFIIDPMNNGEDKLLEVKGSDGDGRMCQSTSCLA